ncbi:MAG: hypothetical protein JOY87_05170 [Candidatus Eremiobacteraeota bacterium]|nr:hypothetical protein [Candidatus Eremiobacteraeota bacterium]MBV8338687.1 hypothetical protein [Candidatus Eremiobacteraeota bacterium]MBV8668586.1 hypothetical protein [Candidatus Eremiobacteraeota bacterium]MBV8670221.1 hypothetical protein [Candidatus Eremiobacteraeota bacterium]
MTPATPNACTTLMGGKKRKRKKRVSARHIQELADSIAIQRRRAMRPTLPTNAQARISESLAEKRLKVERKRRQRGEWEDL